MGLARACKRATKQLLDLQKLRIPPAPVAPQLTTGDAPLPTDLRNDPNPEIEQPPAETQLTTDDRQLTTVFAYSSPLPRVARVYFGVRTGLEAMAA